MSIEDLPAPIKQFIVRETERDKIFEDNRLGVTELIGCLRKAWYRRKMPLPLSIQQRWWFYRGNLLDGVWTPLFERNQVRITHRIRDYPVVISGRIDFIDEDGAVADLKTIDNLYWIKKEGAKADHIKQVLFYAWCEARDKARLYYVSMNDAVPMEVAVSEENKLEVVNELESNAKILYNALVNNIVPERDDKHTQDYWECGVSKDGVCYCEYREQCWKSESEDKE